MRRIDIINCIGAEYLTENIENGEFSYPKAFRESGIEFEAISDTSNRTYEKLDLRFVKDGITVLVETKIVISLREKLLYVLCRSI